MVALDRQNDRHKNSKKTTTNKETSNLGLQKTVKHKKQQEKFSYQLIPGETVVVCRCRCTT